MSSLKKWAAGIGVAALTLVAGAGIFSPTAHAQTSGNSIINNNPISQWIVLSGLFGGNVFGTTSGTSGTNGTVFNSPISQWIVLSGLFGGNVFGNNSNSANGTVFNNPISQWIVLSELFGGQNLLQ